jgi:hypothetical protein
LIESINQPRLHLAIVSKPFQYEDSIALLRSSLDQLEKIAILQLPGAINHSNTCKQSKSPPPVPPKPTAILQKPTIPPKPKQIPTVTHPITNILKESNDSTETKRSRGNSVSFAEDTKLETSTIPEDNEKHKLNKLTEQRVFGLEEAGEELDDDDDDDTMIEFSACESSARSSNGINYCAAPSRVGASATKRPATTLSIQTPLSALKLSGRSKSWVVESHSSSTERDPIDVLLETVVNPRHLVPAQTNTGDSLALPTATQTNDYVPNIPAPPLLATHRRLQQRLHELETDLEECEEKDEWLRSERAHHVHCARQTLEKVRSLYMSAMTIPSILQFPPQLIAYQLTLIESSIFRGIPKEALLTHSARTPHRKIVASTDFFNFITRSIEHSILLPQEASRRAEIIHRWIKIATKLLTLNNYQTLKAIVSALGTPPVKRLRRTWECIPKKRMVRLELLNSLMSETDNYSKYREHMGLERRRLWSKPVVPFLGVFIHDVTYLYAAAKGNQEDARVQDVLNSMQLFQKAPEYPQTPPLSFMNINTKKYLFRPMSDKLHFTSSSKRSNNRITTAALMGEDQGQETEIELEQQLIIQYILMRPWVSEKTIDALSTLREPPKTRSYSSPTTARYSTDNNTLSITTSITSMRSSSGMASPTNGANPSSNTSPTTTHTSLPSSNNSSSILSGASVFMRFNNNNSETDNQQSIMPTITPNNEESKKSLVGGFWPFRKSTDMSRNIVTDIQDQTWSEEDEEEDDEEEEEEEDETIVPRSRSKNSDLNARGRPSTIYLSSRNKGHSRSVSLPTKSILVSDMYRS